jgi:hypothetical protein
MLYEIWHYMLLGFGAAIGWHVGNVVLGLLKRG